MDVGDHGTVTASVERRAGANVVEMSDETIIQGVRDLERL
jgi:hypothetical protein